MALYFYIQQIVAKYFNTPDHNPNKCLYLSNIPKIIAWFKRNKVEVGIIPLRPGQSEKDLLRKKYSSNNSQLMPSAEESAAAKV
ncbi:hypothetical protein [Pontibacter chitinilyticus]|uniref:hypothetical protein n=1 Tax=Pontibacter chitinilyticus TaxID=2674989 RepID=UPI00321918C9